MKVGRGGFAAIGARRQELTPKLSSRSLSRDNSLPHLEGSSGRVRGQSFGTVDVEKVVSAVGPREAT